MDVALNDSIKRLCLCFKFVGNGLHFQAFRDIVFLIIAFIACDLGHNHQ